MELPLNSRDAERAESQVISRYFRQRLCWIVIALIFAIVVLVFLAAASLA